MFIALTKSSVSALCYVQHGLFYAHFHVDVRPWRPSRGGARYASTIGSRSPLLSTYRTPDLLQPTCCTEWSAVNLLTGRQAQSASFRDMFTTTCSLLFAQYHRRGAVCRWRSFAPFPGSMLLVRSTLQLAFNMTTRRWTSGDVGVLGLNSARPGKTKRLILYESEASLDHWNLINHWDQLCDTAPPRMAAKRRVAWFVKESGYHHDSGGWAVDPGWSAPWRRTHP